MSTLHDVLSDGMVARLLDEDYADNGNWIPAINGVIIPACTSVEDAPVPSVQSYIRTDARKSPDAELRHYNTDPYMITLNVASQQANILNEALGMGAEIMDKAATNTERTVGDPTGVPTAIADALYGAFLVTGTPANQGMIVPALTLPHTDFMADKGGVAGSGSGTNYMIAAYDYSADLFTTQGTHVVWNDPFLGMITLAGMTLGGTYTFTWDPAESGIVTLAGDSAAVDFVDPRLDRGDTAVIFSFAYLWGQLTGNADYSVTQPLEKATRCCIDMFRSLGDSIQGKIWERRRYMHCEQRAIPPSSTDGSNENPNVQAYQFNVRFNDARLGAENRYYARDFYVEAIST